MPSDLPNVERISAGDFPNSLSHDYGSTGPPTAADTIAVVLQSRDTPDSRSSRSNWPLRQSSCIAEGYVSLSRTVSTTFAAPCAMI